MGTAPSRRTGIALSARSQVKGLATAGSSSVPGRAVGDLVENVDGVGIHRGQGYGAEAGMWAMPGATQQKVPGYGLAGATRRGGRNEAARDGQEGSIGGGGDRFACGR